MFKHNLSSIYLAPDPAADFQLFDRVICVRDGYPVSGEVSEPRSCALLNRFIKCYIYFFIEIPLQFAAGAKGTIISIQPNNGITLAIRHDNLHMMKVLMDKPFGGDNSRLFKAYSTAMFLNISYGARVQ